MGSYRNRLDIIADILRVVVNNEKTIKTRIMYQANLSYELLKKYLAEVLKSDLVRLDPAEKFYVITCKGEKFLDEYKKYARQNMRLEEKLNEFNNTRDSLEKLSLGR